MSAKIGRGSRIDAIEDLIKEIEDQLNNEQKIKIKDIEKPALKGLEKKNIWRIWIVYVMINIKNNDRTILLICLILIISNTIKSQSVFISEHHFKDSIYSTANKHNVENTDSSSGGKDYLTPTIETIGNNVFVFYLNKYALGNPGWTKISFKTVKYNLEHGFVWDHDGFEMNALFHPYSGALSYTAARSTGLGFWNSIAYPFAGSFMWEIVMENELPSSNDLISTTTSGIVLGEISFRVSSLLLNDNATGGERVWREITAGILSPVHGLNRLISGKSWSVGPKPQIPNYSVSLSAGILGLFIDRNLYQKHPHGYLNVQLDYGNLFSLSSRYDPFDYFNVTVGLGFTITNTIINISGSGMLWGNKIKIFQNGKNIIGIFKNYDFLNTATYRVGSSSVGIGLITKVQLSEQYILESTLIPSIILVGAINSEYAKPLGRDYNLGPGLEGKMRASITNNNLGKLYMAYDRSWIYVISGARGDEVVGIWQAGVQVHLSHSTTWTFEYLNYSHIGTYNEYPSLQKNNIALRTYIIANI